MQLSKKQEAELLEVYESWWNSYLAGDVKTYDSFLDDDYHFIGSTNGEEYLNRKDTTDFFKATADQLAGKAELRNLKRTIEELDGGLMLITDVADAYINIESEWVFYSRFRFTSLMKERNNGWRFIYQHFSAPDTKAQEGETLGTEQISKENRELRDAIKRRTVELEHKTRELEIESSLERVRTVAMSMNKPDDMLDVCRIISEQLELLNVKDIRNVQTAIINEAKGIYLNYEYFTQYKRTSILEIVTKLHPTVAEFAKEMMRSKDAFFTKTFEGGDLQDWREYRNKTNQDPDPMLDKANSVHYYFYSIGTGALGISAYAPLSEDEISLFKRFRNVFDLAYRRFIDIEKAEAQAKEAQIETSLERVRAQAMAMRTPEELTGICEVLYKELNSLGFTEIRNSMINIHDDEKETFVNYDYSDEIGKSINHLHYNIHPLIEKQMKEIRNAEGFSETSYTGKDLEDMITFRKKIGEKDDPRIEQAEALYYYFYSIGTGSIGISTFNIIAGEKLDVLKRFRNVFTLAYQRYTDIAQAEAQARESEIELALERVRARTMAMQRSDELVDVATVLFQQVKALGVPQWNCGFNIWNMGDDEFTYYPGSPDGILSPSPCKFSLTEHPVFMRFDESRKRGDELLIYEKEGEEQADHYRYMLSLPGVGDLLQSMLDAGFELPKFQIDHLANFAYGNLIFITYEHFPNMHDVFKRFAKVFEQTYTRFLDLQKAEAQAKEAQLELSLERIRAKVTAMQQSSELLDIVVSMRTEFVALGHEANYFWYMRWLPDIYEKAMTSGDGTRIGMVMTLPRHIHGDIKLLADWEKGKDPSVVYAMDTETAVDYVEKMINLGDFKQVDPNAPTLDDIRHIAGLTFIMARTTYGEIGFSLPGVVNNPPAEAVATLIRFAVVFDLAYRRFEDLKNAEFRNRQTEIELALEKVRSRSMAMHKSEDLKDVIKVVYDQFVHLNIPVEHAGFIMDYKERDDMHIWLADQHAVPYQVTIPYFDCAHWNSFNEAKANGQNFFTNQLSFDEKNNFYQDLFKIIPGVPEEILSYYFSCPGLAISTVLLDNVGLYIENFSGTPFTDEENEMLMRFGKVFQQTYTRFLDLQKAEEQAREAKIEAALERTRTQSMIMQHSNELDDTLRVFHQQVLLLGIKSAFSFLWLPDEKSDRHIFWAVWKENNSAVFKSKTINYPLDRNEPATAQCLIDWKSNEPVYSYHVPVADVENYFAVWQELIDGVEHVKPEYFSSGLNYVEAFMKYGCFGVMVATDLSEDEKKLLNRFAIEFERTYTRFLDLQKAEAQAIRAEHDLIAIKEAKQKAEDALLELQVTQKQLIQSEKMASLGELTAGIAHEIQNPLNFVNNFSEVSNELILEIKEERAKNIENRDEELVDEILNDITQNLEKINHHGKRADAIVKGMLQHSRSSSAVKEPTDINKLADEYLRLAYHGLRAKDKNFNATMNTDFDETIGKIEIIPQDMGRVILNLITNAFYATNEKQTLRQAQGDNYDPTVTVSTKKVEDKVEIKVVDNGNGIPKEVLDKIFQPFFTTKPTGQGTGLGLSLSYDIVKAHGGELKVETTEGEGSEFIITLPV